jgi:hypothetical protein
MLGLFIKKQSEKPSQALNMQQDASLLVQGHLARPHRLDRKPMGHQGLQPQHVFLHHRLTCQSFEKMQ